MTDTVKLNGSAGELENADREFVQLYVFEYEMSVMQLLIVGDVVMMSEYSIIIIIISTKFNLS